MNFNMDNFKKICLRCGRSWLEIYLERESGDKKKFVPCHERGSDRVLGTHKYKEYEYKAARYHRSV